MPIRAGFRAVQQRPALALAEIAWRWAFGAAALTLVFVVVHRILAQVDITEAERLLARHSDVFLLAEACARILAQVLPQLVRECLVLAPAMVLLWVAAATVGRGITLQTLLATPVILGEASPAVGDAEDPGASRIASGGRSHFGRLAMLNLVRAVFTLASLIALGGGLILVGLAFPAQNPATAMVIGLSLAALAGFFWSVINWFLALAPIWILRDGRSALQSMGDSIQLYRRAPTLYVGIATGFGLLRGMALLAALGAAVLAARASPTAAVAASVAIALAYFAVADFLYIARLAAYVALAESSQLSPVSSPPVAPLVET